MKDAIIECVPNFSEGRDIARVDRIASAVSRIPGVLILDRTSDWDHHRSVITFAGRLHAVSEAAFVAAREARDLIDLRTHRGVHPRLGALDVLPFVPLANATMAQCVDLAHAVGRRMAAELRVPVYFYGEAALSPERRLLEHVRHGQFEALREAALSDPSRAPDAGGPAFHLTAGATVVGARKILIAFNINLHSDDLALAKLIARTIRTSNGGFPAVKALGLPLQSRHLVQVSMNLTDYEQTPVHEVYAAVREMAATHGATIEATELIGLWPRRAYEEALASGMKMPPHALASVIEERLRPLTAAIELESPFLAGEKLC